MDPTNPITYTAFLDGRRLSTGPLHELKVFVRRDVLGPLKKHVLEQVRKTGPLKPFIGRADVIPQVDRHNGCRVILREYHLQAIREAVALDRDVHQTILVVGAAKR